MYVARIIVLPPIKEIVVSTIFSDVNIAEEYLRDKASDVPGVDMEFAIAIISKSNSMI